MHLPVLLEGMSKGALAAAPQDVPVLAGEQLVHPGAVVGEEGPDDPQTRVDPGEAGIRRTRTRRRQVFLRQSGGSGEVHRGWVSRAGGAYVREMVGYTAERDGRGAVRGGGQALRVVQPGDEARPLRVRMRGKRSAEQQRWRRHVGATAGVAVREATAGCLLSPGEARYRDRHTGDQHLLLGIGHHLAPADPSPAERLAVQHHPGDGVTGNPNPHLLSPGRRKPDAQGDPRVRLGEHPEAAGTARRRAKTTLPPGLRATVRLRGRQRREVRPRDHLPARSSLRAKLHVHHHAGRGTRATGATAHGLVARAHRRRQSRDRVSCDVLVKGLKLGTLLESLISGWGVRVRDRMAARAYTMVVRLLL